MKLSDAIVLGSTTCKMERGDWNCCILGAGANAMGLPRAYAATLMGCDISSYSARIEAMKRQWPWLMDIDQFGERAINKIPHIFDRFVCGGAMSFEDLLQMIRRAEPECGECNCRVCACARPEASALEPGLEEVAAGL